MFIYTAEFVDKLNKRFAQKPPYQQSTIYRIATEPHWENLRQEIERWVSQFPNDASKNVVISRLRSPEHFEQTYNELVVGQIFRDKGYAIEYEKEIVPNTTPDWYIYPRINTPTFIVEVLTSMPPEERTKQDQKWHELTERLKKIPMGIGLSIFPLPVPSIDHNMLNSRDIKQIVDQVHTWLLATPELKDTIEISGIRFGVIHKSATFKTIQTAITGTFWGRSAETKQNIRDKVKKYETLCLQGIPIVVAVMANFLAGFDREDLETIISDGEGIFTGRKPLECLSAILWASNRPGQPNSIASTIYGNANAKVPLSINEL